MKPKHVHWFDCFWVLNNKMGRKSLHLDYVGNVNAIDPWAVTIATMKPKEPIVYEFFTNNPTLSDYAGTTYPPLCAISYKVVTLLELNQYTGWSTYPIRIHNKQGAEILGYQGFSVTGRCGKIQEKKARKEKVTMPGGVFDKRFGLYFDSKSWDGSDVFCPEGTAIIIVTDKVKQALEKAKITNIEFTNLYDYEHP